ncbi:MAG: cytochrome c peroxidase [Kiritimatiellia bacterium]|jgi:cytochrome c peroxidase
MGNPCDEAMANPCGSGMANPFGGGGMAMVDVAKFTQPKGVNLAAGSAKKLTKQGAKLWSHTSLSTNRLSCASCHSDTRDGPFAMMSSIFANPHAHTFAMT